MSNTRRQARNRGRRTVLTAAAAALLTGAGVVAAAPAQAAPTVVPLPHTRPHHDAPSAGRLTSRLHGALTAAPAATPAGLPGTRRAPARGPAGPRVIGGGVTSISAAPWMAQLWYYDDKGTTDTGDDVSFFCGATVVSPTKILTSAACVSGWDWADYGVVVTGTDQLPTNDTSGDTDLHGGTLSAVWRQWTDPSYRLAADDSTDNDVAVLTLPAPVAAEPLPITTAGDTSSYQPGTQARLYGWGATSSTDDDLSQSLESATLPVDSDASCSAYYGADFVAGHMTCAGTASGTDTDTVTACDGDFGGPLVVAGRLVGVMSWGVQGCVAQGSSSVFARVATYVGAVEPRIDDTDGSGDGRADMLAITPAGSGYQYDSNGSGFAPRVSVGDWSGLNLVRQTDLDRDGYGDLLLRATNGVLYWDHYVPADDSWTDTGLGGGWNSMKAVAIAGDVDGDALPDMAAVDSSGNLWLYPGKGDGRFGSRVRIGYGWNIYGADVLGHGDLTGDGRADLLAQDSSGNLWLYKGDGTSFAPRVKVGYGYHYTAYVTSGDITGDGRADLVARDSSGNLWLYKGTGSATAPLAARVKIGYGYGVYNLFG